MCIISIDLYFPPNLKNITKKNGKWNFVKLPFLSLNIKLNTLCHSIEALCVGFTHTDHNHNYSADICKGNP